MSAERIINRPSQREAARELSEAILLANYRGLEIYTLTGNDCPKMMQCIGELREQVFRNAGAGRGGEADLDELDFGPNCYHQLIVWDPDNEELVGLYRYRHAAIAAQAGDAVLRTSGLFEYSAQMRRDVLPVGIELGRSVVSETAAKRRLGFFALWQGLAALLHHHPETRYFFGNVTLYRTIPEPALKKLVAHLQNWYAPAEPMLKARAEVRFDAGADTSVPPAPESPRARIAELREMLAPFDERLPPILQSYMRLGNSIYMGETVHDADFGGALEIGIIVDTTCIEGDIQNLFLT